MLFTVFCNNNKHSQGIDRSEVNDPVHQQRHYTKGLSNSLRHLLSHDVCNILSNLNNTLRNNDQPSTHSQW
jgi:hypothetical protein